MPGFYWCWRWCGRRHRCVGWRRCYCYCWCYCWCRSDGGRRSYRWSSRRCWCWCGSSGWCRGRAGVENGNRSSTGFGVFPYIFYSHPGGGAVVVGMSCFCISGILRIIPRTIISIIPVKSHQGRVGPTDRIRTVQSNRQGRISTIRNSIKYTP